MARPEYVVGYQGTPLHYVDKGTAVAICGNALCQYSLTGGLNSHLMWGPAAGLQTSAYHVRENCIAFAEKGLKPAVHVHDIRNDNREIATLTEVAELEVLVLAFSNISWRFVTASGEPDFCLVLWDLDPNKGAAKIMEGKLDDAIHYASFCPTSIDKVCVSGNGQIAIWTYEQSFHRKTWTPRFLQCKPHQPHCHVWAQNGETIYAGGLKGEVLSFDVKGPFPKPGSPEAAAAAAAECKLLITIENPEKIVGLCVGENHMVVVGISGNCQWLGFPVRIQMIKPVEVVAPTKKRKGRAKRGEKVEEVAEDEYEPIDPNDFRIVEELHLAVSAVTTAQYRKDETQLLVGSSNGCITTIKVDVHQLQAQLTARPGDAPEKVGKVVALEWQSSFHSGPIMAMAILSGGKFVATCGKDGTMRVWSAEWGKEISRQIFKSPQLCLCIGHSNGIVATGSMNGAMNILKVDSGGRSNFVHRMKLHSGSINQISFSETGTIVLAASRNDGRIFFLLNKSPVYDDLELLGFTVMNDPVIAHAWDAKPSTGDKDLFMLVSLARGEIVKLKVPTQPAGAVLQFQHAALNRISFRVGAALNTFYSAKYYVDKEKVEKRIIWGFGQDKKLLQYRLPENASQWTGPEATPQTPHFNIAGHHKAGCALMLLPQEQVLVSGATDGTLQIRTNVLDPLKPPQKTLEIQCYDFYLAGITCLTVHNGMVFTGGENGVIFAFDCSEAGLKRASATRSDQPRAFPPTEHPSEDPAELSAVQTHDQAVETRYMQLGQPKRNEMKATIQTLRKDFQEIYEKNSRAPPLEKLTAKEMIVDVELEAELRAVLDKKVEEAREEIRISDLNKDILAERIKEECWTVMAEPGTAVWPFGSGYQVWSFPLLGLPTFDLKMARLAKFYRHVEMYEHHYMKRLQKELAEIAKRLAVEQAAKEAAELAAQQAEIDAANALAFGPPPGGDSDSETDKASEGSRRSEGSMTSEMSVNLDNPDGGDPNGSRRSSMAPRESMRSSMRESVVAGSETEASSTMEDGTSPAPAVVVPPEPEEEEEEELEILESAPAPTFLYTSFELTTSKRKRVQRLLLFMQLKEIRIAFNKKLAEARANKISHISRIAEMKSRILDLHKMLSQPGEYPWPELNEIVDGMPNVFEVKKEEVLVQKHLNKAERARAEELRLFEEQQERLRAGNNAAERALMDMMGGKLEKKLEVAAKEEEIVRPKWMEGNPKKFTKEQHLEIKAFDAMLKQIKDEKEKKIRGQEAEQKKLRADVDDLCGSFNNEMDELFQQRLLDEAKCIGIEESISRLSVGIEIEEVVDEKAEANMNKHMDRLKALKAQSVSSFTDFKREVDAFEEKYNAAVNEDKLQDKNFRKHFSDCGDVVNLLYRKFKDRPSKGKDGGQKAAPAAKKQSMKQTPRSSSRSPSRRTSGSSRKTSGTAASAAAASAEPAVDPFYERPQEVTVPQWERLLDARRRKMAQEEEVNRLTTIMNSMGGFLAELTETDEANRKQIEACLRAMADFRDSRERRRKNLELILNMKLGFVEAILNPLQGDYTDVALMPRTLIEDYNKVVLHEANTKIEMLLAAKTFKAENHGVQWEIAKNHVRQMHVIEKIRALQLLRVTKATQQVIKTGEDPASASESLALEKRFEHNIKMQNHRITDKNYVFEQIQEKIDEIKAQNAKLLVKAKLLHLEHNFQNRLCSSGLAAKQKEEALEQRFRDLYVKRQLKEMVKEQHDQIIALGIELEKTKNRILPVLQDADMSGYDFPARPLHSEIGRDVLEANEEYFESIRVKRRPTATLGHP